MKIFCRVIIGTFMGFSLVACNSTHQAAPIKSITAKTTPTVSGSSSLSNSSSTSNYVAPPKIVKTTPTKSAATNNKTGNIVYNRNYSDIPKGGYQGDFYTVKEKDTLYYIAWITGNDFRSLAEKNRIVDPYPLYVGQVIDVSGSAPKQISTTNRTTTTTPTTTIITPTTLLPKTNIATSTVGAIVWRWPTEGKVIDGFSDSAGGNKGIDIAGKQGQSIVAAAKGRVVYAGNALRGYGNLIIIKHDDDYLSAYAHNDNMLVSEQQDIQAGQKIATMGNTGATSVRLHFEIRYKGNSMNPMSYLPRK